MEEGKKNMNNGIKQNVKSKPIASAFGMCVVQLLIYYPLIIIGWFYAPSRIGTFCESLGTLASNITGIHTEGIIVYIFLLLFLSNICSVLLAFKVLFSEKRWNYTPRTAWKAVWWSFGVQSGVFLVLGFLVVLVGSDGFTKGKFHIASLIYPIGHIAVFFIGTVGTYSLIKFINKMIKR